MKFLFLVSCMVFQYCVFVLCISIGVLVACISIVYLYCVLVLCISVVFPSGEGVGGYYTMQIHNNNTPILIHNTNTQY